MLLTHTAGFSNVQWRLFYYFSLLHYPREWLGEYLQPDGFLYHQDNWNEYPPGEGIYYSSVGYELLGLIIEQVSGSSFESYCKQNIFDPLSMHNTSFQLSDLSIDQFTTIYGYLLGVYFALPYYENHNDAAGGMYTTIEDISHFLLMHMNQGSYQDISLLQPESVEMMHTAQFTDLPGFDIYKDNRKYGFGWIVWPDGKGSYQNGLQGHLGNVPGGLSSMTVFNDTGVIFFGNEWFRVSYQQTFVMGWLREYFHTQKIPTRP
jgi:CubicO group peptidase (beta-lactamase class C family)